MAFPPAAASRLADMEDVELAALAGSQVIAFDAADNRWENEGLGDPNIGGASYAMPMARWVMACPSDGATAFTTNPTSKAAGAQVAVPFSLSRPATIDRMGVIHNGADTMALRLGIYRDNGDWYPGELELDAGLLNLAGAPTGLAQVVIANHRLAAKLYWITYKIETLGGGGIVGARATASIFRGGLRTADLVSSTTFPQFNWGGEAAGPFVNPASAGGVNTANINAITVLLRLVA